MTYNVTLTLNPLVLRSYNHEKEDATRTNKRGEVRLVVGCEGKPV